MKIQKKRSIQKTSEKKSLSKSAASLSKHGSTLSKRTEKSSKSSRYKKPKHGQKISSGNIAKLLEYYNDLKTLAETKEYPAR